MNYNNLLKSPKWQKRRLEIFERDNFTCTLCGDKETELHAHHKYYEKGLNPWEHSDECLITVCKHCHREIHFYEEYSKEKINYSKFSTFKLFYENNSYTIYVLLEFNYYLNIYNSEDILISSTMCDSNIKNNLINFLNKY